MSVIVSVCWPHLGSVMDSAYELVMDTAYDLVLATACRRVVVCACELSTCVHNPHSRKACWLAPTCSDSCCLTALLDLARYRYVLWPMYWWWQGAVLTGLWVIAHECGECIRARMRTVHRIALPQSSAI